MNKIIIFLFTYVIPNLETILPFYLPPLQTPNSALKTIQGSIHNRELTNIDIPTNFESYTRRIWTKRSHENLASCLVFHRYRSIRGTQDSEKSHNWLVFHRYRSMWGTQDSEKSHNWPVFHQGGVPSDAEYLVDHCFSFLINNKYFSHQFLTCV